MNRLVDEGTWPATAPRTAEIQDTKNPEHGDFATNYALMASKALGRPPRDIAAQLVAKLESNTEFTSVEIAGPGFINLRLSSSYVAGFLAQVLDSGVDFAKKSADANSKRINVEFVSVNPNGPITIGSGRGAAYGSTLCNVLEAAGNTIHREYYINDGVNSEQMRVFATSVRHLVQARDTNLPYEVGKHISDWTMTTNLRFIDEFLESQGPTPVWALEQNDVDLNNAYLEYISLISDAGADIRHRELADWHRRRLSSSGDWILEVVRSRFTETWSTGTFRAFGYKGDYVEQVAQTAINLFSKGFKDRIAYAQTRLADSADPVVQALFKRHLKCYERLDKLRDNLTAVEAIAQADLMDLKLICETLMTESQSEALSNFGVKFDTWFSEQTLHDQGIVDELVEQLVKNGVADEDPYRTVVKFAKGGKIDEIIKEPQTAEMEVEDGEEAVADAQGTTLWLRSTMFGDDMDRVLRRRDGRPTYITSDVAYHKDKFRRPENADKLITVLGPDHHGYIGRLTAVVAALLKRPDQSNEDALAEARAKLDVQIFQLVRFVKDGKPAPMRKRDGNIFALSDLVNEIGAKVKPTGSREEQLEAGRDVARFFYLMRSHDTTFDFDLDLASKQSDENPVFYVQYAHARISSVIAKAAAAGITAEGADLNLLVHDREKALICKVADLPNEVARSAADYCVHRLTTFAIELARTYHHFYDACRVIQPDQLELTRARLALCEGTKIGLRAVCKLLGVSTPDRMDRTEAALEELPSEA